MALAPTLTRFRNLPPLARVVLLLLLVRLGLNVPALLGANAGAVLPRGDGSAYPLDAAQSLPVVWANWDGGFYLHIAEHGYAVGGKEVAFFPGYPLLIRLLALGQPAAMPWVGYLVSNLAFVLAGAFLWRQVRDEHGEGPAWATVISLAVFPTAFFFSALYAESLYVLLGVLVYWFSVRKRYGLAALCVAAVSLVRITGLLFILIPVVEIWLARPPAFLRQRSFWLTVAGVGLLSGVGVAVFGGYLWLVHGTPIAFVDAHETFWMRSTTWPWVTVLHSAGVVLFGYGGSEGNWFMRAISAQDLAAALLFVGLTVVAWFRLRRSLFAYQLAALLFILASHGPYALGLWSAGRIVLGLVPGFIVLGLLLDRLPRAKWWIWSAALALQFFLTAWFANGRWVD